VTKMLFFILIIHFILRSVGDGFANGMFFTALLFPAVLVCVKIGGWDSVNSVLPWMNKRRLQMLVIAVTLLLVADLWITNSSISTCFLLANLFFVYFFFHSVVAFGVWLSSREK